MSDMKDSYNKGGMLTIVVSIVLICCFFVYISFIHPGINLGEIPKGAESDGAKEAVSFNIATVEKPWVESKDVAEHGKTVYANSCAMCHGSGGQGDGAAGAALVPKPRDLVKGNWKKGGTSIALFNTVTNGLKGTSMAGYKYMSVADRWALVQFIRSITKSKGVDNGSELSKFAETAD